MLIIFGGLPGTGKTTLARALAEELDAVYLRIDTIEQALSSSRGSDGDVLDAGYRIACAVACDNLTLGRTVVGDCVNPLFITRNAWRSAAAAARTSAIEIEVICSDLAEHRRRVESRRSDIPGLCLPSWQEVMSRDYEPWEREHITVDTGTRSVAQGLQQIRAMLAG